jgi:hypothetical protein
MIANQPKISNKQTDPSGSNQSKIDFERGAFFFGLSD